MQFRMLGSVFPGDTMTLAGVVRAVEVDATGCGWVAVDVTLSVADRTCTEAGAAAPSRPAPTTTSGTARQRWQP